MTRVISSFLSKLSSKKTAINKRYTSHRILSDYTSPLLEHTIYYYSDVINVVRTASRPSAAFRPRRVEASV